MSDPLATNPTDDLTTELKQAKRPANRWTVGLIAAVALVAAFFGGIAVHSAVADEPQPAATGGPGGQIRVPGGGGGQGQLARGTVGTIDRIEGADIYVKTPDGRTVKVSTSDSTKVRVSQEGQLSDLAQGDTVLVQGQTGGDGTVTAEAINEQPLGARATG